MLVPVVDASGAKVIDPATGQPKLQIARTGLNQRGRYAVRISGANLAPHYDWADPARSYAVEDVPLLEFSGNTAFGSFNGFESWFTLLHADHDSRSVIENFKVFSVSTNAIEIPYTANMTFRNVTLTGNVALPRNVGIQRNAITQDIIYDHVTAQGFEIGINAPLRGTNTIIGGKLNNLRNINIVTAADRNRVIEINDASPTDPVQFINNLKKVVNGVLTSVKQYDIYLDANFRPLFDDITTLFNPDRIRIGLVTHNGQQVYFHEQAAGFTPFPSTTQSNTTLFGPKAAAYVPADLLDKTNAQLVAQYGLAIAGIIAPANAIPNPQINGIVGPAAQYPVDLHHGSPKYYNHVVNGPYKLIYGYVNPATNQAVYISETTGTPLHNGWNVITRQVLGQPRSFLVFGDDTPPNLQLSANMPGVINKADLDNGATLLIDGQLVDNSFGTRHFQQTIKLNDAKYVSALKTRADGSQFVTITLTIMDNAKNISTVHIDLNVTLTATLLKDIGRRDDPFFVSSETLLALLGI